MSNLGDCFTLQRGRTYKSKLLGEAGPVLLGLATIARDGGFRDNSLNTYGGDSPEELLVRPGELYVSLKDVTQSGDLLGSVARLPASVELGRLTQDTVKLQPKAGCPPVDYLYWLLRTPQYRAHCRGHATGTTNLGLAREDFLSFEVPPLTPEREVLTRVIQSLDDKIEQNRRTSRALEGLARATFKAWFVDFEPVKAKAAGQTSFPGMPPAAFAALPERLIDSPLGPVPQGWEVSKLGDVIDIHDSRRIPLSKKQREDRRGAYRYYGAAGIVDHVNEFLFDGIYVLTGEDGTVVNDDGTPVTQYVWGQFWVNNHAHVLTAKSPFSSEHLLLLLQSLQVKPFVTGAVQPKLSQGNMKSIPVVLPPPQLAASFAVAIEPLFALVRASADESSKLAALRDYLLPRLLSGRVRVNERHATAEVV